MAFKFFPVIALAAALLLVVVVGMLVAGMLDLSLVTVDFFNPVVVVVAVSAVALTEQLFHRVILAPYQAQ